MSFEIGKLYQWNPPEKHRKTSSNFGFSMFQHKDRTEERISQIPFDGSVLVIDKDRTVRGYCLKVLAASSINANVGYIFIDDKYSCDWVRLDTQRTL